MTGCHAELDSASQTVQYAAYTVGYNVYIQLLLLIFMKVAIIGLGLLGGSFALALKRHYQKRSNLGGRP